ncbi:MAG: hypothetical protein EHM41_20080 [Chloroflexi bacterium]|nr:MAG: hypothetical protein EHM41_20080 [Chloroflexota bacterium]
MKNSAVLKWIIPVIFLMSLVAAGVGLFWETDGQPYPFTSIHGEAVTINGHGLYYYDTVSTAAQMQANDTVTLVLGLPLLAISTWLAFRGSLRGQLLLAGTLGFFLYTYMSMSFNTAYNPFFLLYTALFSLSLFSFIITMMSFDRKTLPQHFSEKLPRRAIAGLMFTAAFFLLFAWVGGRILPTLLQDQTPSMENTTTMVIQVMDLGLIVPLAFLSGLLLLRRESWGYLLASVTVMKMLTMGAAVSAMGINMVLNGVEVSVIELGVFPALTLANMVMAYFLLKNIDSRPMTALPA